MRRSASLAVVLAWLAATAALASCGSDGGAEEDGIPLPDRVPSADDEAGVTDAEAGPACDPTKPFGPPKLVAGLDDLEFYATPRLAPDELTIYFTTLRAIDGSLQADLVSAVRATPDAPFERPALLTALDTTASENDPTIGADLRALWFSSTRTGNSELYVARRATPTEPFGPAALVPGLSSPSQEMHPYYRHAGPELWFTSDRGDAGVDIYVAPLQGGSFGPATVVKELSSTAGEAHIYVSEDGLHALLASTRDGGAGGWDLWVAARGASSERFAQPTPLAEVNAASDEYGGWISPDGCRVYFSSNRDTEAQVRHRIWFAERPR